MNSYKDVTFCEFYRECSKFACIRALTPKVKKDAKKAGRMIWQYTDTPECFQSMQAEPNFVELELIEHIEDEPKS